MSATDIIRGLGRALVLGLYFGTNFVLGKVSNLLTSSPH